MDNLKNKIKELTSEPGRIFGLVYPYILIVIIAAGLLYISNLGNIARQNVPPVPPDTTKQTDLPVVEPRTIPAVNILEVSKLTPELLLQGKESYNTICASCHGEDGKGKGPASTGLNPPPRDYTNKEGWKNGPKLSQIYQTLEEGIPGSGMISYNYLSPIERIAIAHYVRETFIPDPPADTEGELTALDQTYSLSQGKEVPAQVPVETAINIIIRENDSAFQNLLQKINRINSANDYRTTLFNDITSNKVKALTTLNSDLSWKSDYQKFVRSIVSEVNRNGFNGNVFKLTSDDWNTLYNYMNELF